ncbi:hypothetical protein [Asanoa sp. NPDC050611]|uniref:Rv0361 family membrane protein n=1 Tax=Asanoa sp. NPDC050611 TaxID=3157098 RepID=UPI00340EF1FA
MPPGTEDLTATAPHPAPLETPPPPNAAPPWTPVPPLPGPGQQDSSAPWPAPPRVSTKKIVLLIVLAAVVLCGGGGLAAFLVTRDTETGEGAAEPVAAVESFLDAIYVDQNAGAAAALVCRDARDQRTIQDKVDEVQRYARTYPNPRYRWDPPKVEQQDADKAVVSTRLTVLTADDRSAEQQLRFTLVHQTGWWVCDVG